MNDLPLRPAASSAQAATLPSSEQMREVELSVVVPAYNERDNVAELIERLDAALRGVVWEVIYVDDDSPDGTANEVRARARVDRRRTARSERPHRDGVRDRAEAHGGVHDRCARPVVGLGDVR